MLKKMADYFETSIDYLVGHTDIRHKIEPVTELALNERENRLIQAFRKLPTSVRKDIETLVTDISISKEASV
ncbi:MAG: hypothetical protein ABF449_12290 [Ethanoligenens sp.]